MSAFKPASSARSRRVPGVPAPVNSFAHALSLCPSEPRARAAAASMIPIPAASAAARSARGHAGVLVVAERGHFDLAPRWIVEPAVKEPAAQLVVAVGENVGLHDYLVSRAALDREAAAVHARRHLPDYCPTAPFGIRDPGHDGYPRFSKRSTDSGGSVSAMDWAQPCAGTGSASTPPKLPMPVPQ